MVTIVVVVVASIRSNPLNRFCGRLLDVQVHDLGAIQILREIGTEVDVRWWSALVGVFLAVGILAENGRDLLVRGLFDFDGRDTMTTSV